MATVPFAFECDAANQARALHFANSSGKGVSKASGLKAGDFSIGTPQTERQ
jgi:hypothetical protein